MLLHQQYVDWIKDWEETMSFSVYMSGSPAAVSAECDRQVKQFDGKESEHATATKHFIKEVLKGAPADSIVIIEAGGHHDYSERYSSGSIDIRFRLMKKLPEPTEASGEQTKA